MEVVLQLELGISQGLLLIAQHIHPLPAAPLVQGLIDITDALFCRHLRRSDLVACDGQFASLLQVSAGLHQGVQLLAVPLIVFCRRHTGCGAIAHLIIIGIERQIVFQFIADDTQQVVTEETAVSPLDDKRLIGFILHLGKLCAERLVEHWLRGRHLQGRVILAHTVEHRLIDRLQRYLLRGLATGDDAFHGGLQRVGGNALHHQGALQLCFQQLPVGLFLRSLRDNLLQDFILRLG